MTATRSDFEQALYDVFRSAVADELDARPTPPTEDEIRAMMAYYFSQQPDPQPDPKPDPEPRSNDDVGDTSWPTSGLNPRDLLVDVRAHVRQTYFPDRMNEAQIVSAGGTYNFFNGGNDPTTDRHGRVPFIHQTDGTIRSFEMRDGTDVRFGPVARGGRRWIRSAGQYVPGNALESDMMFAGGLPRTQMAFFNSTIRCGPGADQTVWATEFLVEPWMFGNGHTTGPFELHAPPNAAQSAPMGAAIKNGKVIFWAKTAGENSPEQSPLSFPGKQPRNEDNVTLGVYDLPDPGRVVTLLTAFRCDYSLSESSYFHLWELPYGSRFNAELRPVDSYEGRFGYYYSDFEKSGLFYPQVGQLYVPHYEGMRYDLSSMDGPTRRLDWSFAAVANRDKVSVEQMAQWALDVREESIIEAAA